MENTKINSNLLKVKTSIQSDKQWLQWNALKISSFI